MNHTDGAFTVASEDRLIDLIQQARQRLVVVCPALTDPVADALIDRLSERGEIRITVILDVDPEVCRLGYGTEAALERLCEAAEQKSFSLHKQEGVRIGVVISDDLTMVFSPVPLMIEAGSTSREKPNAIILSGSAADRLADAAGAEPEGHRGNQEIGREEVTREKVQAVKDDLRENPPQPFDLVRTLRVFNSKVKYVELEIAKYRFSSRRVPIPSELLGISDENLREQITSRIQPPSEISGPFEIWIMTSSGYKKLEVNDKWFSDERKRIADEYTFLIPNFGRVILTADRKDFEEEIKALRHNLKSYYQAVLSSVKGIETDLEDRVFKEFFPRWKQNPPKSFDRYNVSDSDKNLEKELRIFARELSKEMISIEAPNVRLVYKNIAPESVGDSNFLQPLEMAMRRRRVPSGIIESLFSSDTAAPSMDNLNPAS